MPGAIGAAPATPRPSSSFAARIDLDQWRGPTIVILAKYQAELAGFATDALLLCHVMETGVLTMVGAPTPSPSSSVPMYMVRAARSDKMIFVRRVQ
jgi:hypothetical protein